MKIDYGDTIILIDFDGTITDKDTNVEIIEKFGDHEAIEIEKNHMSSEYDKLDVVQLIFDRIKISESEYINYILENFELTKGFIDFYNMSLKKQMDMAIISGGFTNGIYPFLAKYNLESIPVYANSLEFVGKNIKVSFYDKEKNCCLNGPCGNCKVKRFNEFKKKYKKIIFIGDGHTDRWVAQIADLVFAKDELVEFCKKDRVDYIYWDTFDDISKIIF